MFLFNSKKELLIQKRSSTKITFPNCWTNSCCSHPHYNDLELDTDLGIRRAAQRKLNHELGIKELDLNRMHIMGKYIYNARYLILLNNLRFFRYDSVWSENELDYAIVIPNFDGLINSNPEEVANWKYITLNSLQKMKSKMTKDSLKFSPWFLLFLQFDWLNLWWRNLENDKLTEIRDLKQIHILN